MKTTKSKKTSWTKPEVKVLNIKKDTFSGSTGGNEQDAELTKKLK